MYYTLITLLVYLLLGAPTFAFGFNPILMAFVIAIIVDIFVNRGIFTRN